LDQIVAPVAHGIALAVPIGSLRALKAGYIICSPIQNPKAKTPLAYDTTETIAPIGAGYVGVTVIPIVG
jgi:hypothetical protein